MNDVVLGGIIGIAGSAIGAIIPLIAHFHEKKLAAQKSKLEHYENLILLAHECWEELMQLPTNIRENKAWPTDSSPRLDIFRLLHTPELKPEIDRYNYLIQKGRGKAYDLEGDTSDGEIAKAQTAASDSLVALQKRISSLLNK